MTLKKIIGNNVQRLRKAKGLQQEEFCNKVGVGMNRQKLSKIENGHIEISMKTLERLALGLEVPAYELLKDPVLEHQGIKQKLEQIEALPTDKRKALLTTINLYLKEEELRKKDK